MSGRPFASVLLEGRHEAYLFGVPKLVRRDGKLLSLEELLRVAKPEGEEYLGVQSIPVARIIGSEGRSNDFSRSFLPLKSFVHARWTKVRDLFLAGQIDEAIRICEYGGCYIVRDGNHRVSVAKTHGVEFMDAEVTRYRVPVKLPPAMRRSKIPVFAAKLELQRETQLFDFVPEELLGDGQLRSWAILRTLLAKWLEEQGPANSGAASDAARRAAESFRIVYENTRALMRREAVHLLFPEKSELDIFAEVVAFWMRLGEDATPADALLRFIRRTERTRGILSLGHVVSQARRWLLSPTAEEKRFFLQVSRLESIRPDAAIHEGSKRWYRFLGRQLLRWHPKELEKLLGRLLFHDEYVGSWYDELYAPAVQLHRTRGIAAPFPQFYMGWMTWRRRRKERTPEPTGATLAESLDAYLSDRWNRRLKARAA